MAGDNSLREPEEVLRDASTFSAVLGMVEPSTAEELDAIRDVQVCSPKEPNVGMGRSFVISAEPGGV